MEQKGSENGSKTAPKTDNKSIYRKHWLYKGPERPRMGVNMGVVGYGSGFGAEGGDYRGGNSNQRPATEDQNSELEDLRTRAKSTVTSDCISSPTAWWPRCKQGAGGYMY